jgi:DNA-binding GntR family transcriptional regulator
VPESGSEPSRQAQIVGDISTEIASGALTPGKQLPSLPELAQRYGVSIVTVRLAIGRLRQLGLVTSRQGKGSFVRKRTELRRYGLGRYRRSVWGGSQPRSLLDAEAASQGLSVTQDTVVEQVPAPAFVAARLPGVADGTTVYVRRRVTAIEGEINQAADSYFTLETPRERPASSQAPVLVAISRGSTRSHLCWRSRRRSRPACRLPRRHSASRSRKGHPYWRSSAPTTRRLGRSTSHSSSSARTWPSSTTASRSQTDRTPLGRQSCAADRRRARHLRASGTLAPQRSPVSQGARDALGTGGSHELPDVCERAPQSAGFR